MTKITDKKCPVCSQFCIQNDDFGPYTWRCPNKHYARTIAKGGGYAYGAYELYGDGNEYRLSLEEAIAFWSTT